MIEKEPFDIFKCNNANSKIAACAKRTGFDTVEVFVFIVDGDERQYWFVEMPEPEYESHYMSKDANGEDYFPLYALNSQHMNHIGYNEIGFTSNRKMVESALDGDFQEGVSNIIESYLVYA